MSVKSRLKRLLGGTPPARPAPTVSATGTGLPRARPSRGAKVHDLARTWPHGPEPLVFDVGAHTGESIRWYRDAFPRCTIHAFEPDPDSFAQLQADFGRDDKIVLAQLALAERQGEATLYRNLKSQANSLSPINMASEKHRVGGNRPVGECTVPVTTLDAYCGEHGIDRIDILKIDVQTHELEVIAGAADMLGRHAIGSVQLEVVLGNEYDRSLSFVEVEQAFAPHGYRLFSMIDPTYSPITGQLSHCDLIYLNPESFDRCAGIWQSTHQHIPPTEDRDAS